MPPNLRWSPPNLLLVAVDNVQRIVGYTAAHSADAGYRPDGSDRVSHFRGMPIRELRLIKRF